MKEFKIIGNTSVMEGATLNLTCSVESVPPSFVMWTEVSDQNHQNRTKNNLQNKTLADLQNNSGTYLQEEGGISTLFISNITVEDSGKYICTAKYLNKTLKKEVDVSVICEYSVNMVLVTIRSG